MQATDLNFVHGVATFRIDRTTVAKVYFRPDFFKGLNVSWNKKYPYSVSIYGMGAEVSTLQDAIDLINSELY